MIAEFPLTTQSSETSLTITGPIRQQPYHRSPDYSNACDKTL